MQLRRTSATKRTNRGPRRARRDGREQARALRNLPMFARCTSSELRLLDTLTCECEVQAGRVLVAEGRPADQMLIVVSGRARISRNGETLGIAGPGTCVCGRELRAHAPNPITMRAETSVVVRAVNARELRSLLRAMPLVEFVSPPMIRLPIGDSTDRARPAPCSRPDAPRELEDVAANMSARSPRPATHPPRPPDGLYGAPPPPPPHRADRARGGW
jgi:hypothetical protein